CSSGLACGGLRRGAVSSVGRRCLLLLRDSSRLSMWRRFGGWVSGLISITTKSPTLESRSEIKGTGEHCIPSKMITTVRPHRNPTVGADCCESLRSVRGFDQVAVRPIGVLPPMRAVQLLNANEPASLRQLLVLDQPADRVLRLVVGEKLDTGFSAVLIINDDPRRGDAGLYPRRQQHSPDGHRTLSCSRVGCYPI